MNYLISLSIQPAKDNLEKKYDSFNEDVAKEARDFLWKMTDTKIPNPTEIVRKENDRYSNDNFDND